MPNARVFLLIGLENTVLPPPWSGTVAVGKPVEHLDSGKASVKDHVLKGFDAWPPPGGVVASAVVNKDGPYPNRVQIWKTRVRDQRIFPTDTGHVLQCLDRVADVDQKVARMHHIKHAEFFGRKVIHIANYPLD